MRRWIATLLLPAAALSACATLGGGEMPDPAHTLRDTKGAVARAHPLRVRAGETRDGLWINLNRPAYTAVFQIVPGEGVALLSPGYALRGVTQAGHSRVVAPHLDSRARNLWRYDDFRHARYGFASGFRQGPRHLMVVASERPLELGRFERHPGLLRRALGTSRYTSYNSRRVVDDVLAAVVPQQLDESWDVDVVTVWPEEDVLRIPDGHLFRVVCRDGSVRWVPMELAVAVCRDPRALDAPPPPRSPQADTVSSPVDSSGVRMPGGRRPRPEPGAEAGDEAARPRLRIADLRERLDAERRDRPWMRDNPAGRRPGARSGDGRTMDRPTLAGTEPRRPQGDGVPRVASESQRTHGERSGAHAEPGRAGVDNSARVAPPSSSSDVPRGTEGTRSGSVEP
jgi:hypothetical protein